jgi:hypothetical protein
MSRRWFLVEVHPVVEQPSLSRLSCSPRRLDARGSEQGLAVDELREGIAPLQITADELQPQSLLLRAPAHLFALSFAATSMERFRWSSNVDEAVSFAGDLDSLLYVLHSLAEVFVQLCLYPVALPSSRQCIELER